MINLNFDLRKAAEICNRSPHSLRLAIFKGRLKAKKKSGQNGKWMVSLQDLDNYKKQRYDRALSKYHGKPLFEKEHGEYSVKDIAKVLDISPQKIYYALRKKVIPFFRKGITYIINIEDVREYKAELDKKKNIVKTRVYTFRRLRLTPHRIRALN